MLEHSNSLVHRLKRLEKQEPVNYNKQCIDASVHRQVKEDVCCRHLNLQSDSPIVRIDSGDRSVKGNTWPTVVLVCSGRSIFTLLEHAVAKAASLSGAARPRTAKQLPDSINYFGWCTWDAFYSSVSAKVLIFLSPGCLLTVQVCVK